jgi:hypothetical protein
MELNGTHQLPVCGDNATLLGENINITKKRQAALDTSTKFGLK